MIGPEYLFVLLALQILAVSLTSSLKENSKKIYRLAYEGGGGFLMSWDGGLNELEQWCWNRGGAGVVISHPLTGGGAGHQKHVILAAE